MRSQSVRVRRRRGADETFVAVSGSMSGLLESVEAKTVNRKTFSMQNPRRRAPFQSFGLDTRSSYTSIFIRFNKTFMQTKWNPRAAALRPEGDALVELQKRVQAFGLPRQSRSAFRFFLLGFTLLSAAARCMATGAPADARDGDPSSKIQLRQNWQIQSSCDVKAGGQKISTAGFPADGWHKAAVP